MDFAAPANQRIKTKKGENTEKYLDLAKENMTKLPIVVQTVHKNQEKTLGELEIRGRNELFHTTTQLKSAWILRRILIIWGKLLSFRERPVKNWLQWKTTSMRWREKLAINEIKENLQNCRLCYPGWPQNKAERTWKEG